MEKSFIFLKRVVVELGIIIIALASFIGGIIFMNFSQETILIGENYDIWMMTSPWDRGIFILEIFLIFYAIDIIWKKRLKYADDGEYELKTNITLFLRKHRKRRIALLATVFYVVFINVSWIKEERIYIRNILHPFGREYSISNIKEVSTGFYRDYIPLMKNKGEFYYIITLDDGKKLNLNNFSGEGKQYEMDTYLAIEEIDKRIMESGSGIIKISSFDNLEYAKLDNYYIERFKRIIENK